MEATKEKVKILSAGAISAMLRRMAYEIYERNFAESTILLTGIGPRGGYLADRIQRHLNEISPLQVTRADLVKVADRNELAWETPVSVETLASGTILIVDDVLYSGGTVVQALILAADLRPAKIQTAFLIDRGHHLFPVTHDYVGMEMATSLKQYITVEVDPDTERAEAFIF
ncbi:MAG: phosphoribosyltransferase [Bacteroidetes bacterium]|nr:phosphoribosyltransferase [Bacteroidota bacterium]MBP6638863.1 phosphoribosyltransferase [Bacteroidia bacterium]